MRKKFWIRGLLASIVIVLTILLFRFSYLYFQDRLTKDLRDQASARVALFSGTIKGDMQRNSIVPVLLARDPSTSENIYEPSNEFREELFEISHDLGGSIIFISDESGGLVLSTNDEIDEILADKTAFLSIAGDVQNIQKFFLAGKFFIMSEPVFDNISKQPIGTIGVAVSLDRYQALWEQLDVNMVLTDAQGVVLESRNDALEGQSLSEAFGELPVEIEGRLAANSFINLDDQDFYYVETAVGFRGWRLAFLVPAKNARDQINSYIALEILVLAFVALLGLYYLSRQTARQSVRLRRESEELRALNARLLSEMEQRRKAEASLEVAEQSLEQSSKLAVIGQMSAAVGHELNQPLAAMRTYMAGAKMLLRRQRLLEVNQSLNRINDLIDRMSSITRQMRAYARVNEGNIQDFDLRDSLKNALMMMAPQIGQQKIEIVKNIATYAIPVKGDPLRVEQILINLMRNAIDAIKDQPNRVLTITIREENDVAMAIVQDNGPGIDDVEKLFEPFYSTKPAGEGLGLGLAISASYARDMGGNLLAKHASDGGAIFELHLPLQMAQSATIVKKKAV